MEISIAGDIYDYNEAVFVEWLNSTRTASAQNVITTQNVYLANQESIKAQLEEIAKMVTGHGLSFFAKSELTIGMNDNIFFFIRDVPINAVEVKTFGEKSAVDKINAILGKALEIFRTCHIHWWYTAQHGPQSVRIPLGKPLKFEPKMYPMKVFGGDPLGYMKQYYNSNASILFLIGPPGTGKTSLIRQFLWENNLDAYVSYDERVLRGDSMFISFLTPEDARRMAGDKGANIMILEDVSELLQKREMDKNELMARFLNVSDGLIQFPNKKIIFTTNLPSLKDVDPALLRPGRCFNVIEMRPLFYEEAVIACKAAGLPIPLEKKDYTMSELYNQDRVATLTPVVQKIGVIG